MSVSEAGGVIASRDSFTFATIPKSPAPAPAQAKPVVQNMSFPYTPDGTIVYKPVPVSSPPYQPGGEGSAGVAGSTIVPNNLNLNSGEPMKRKRGRPRKYGPDGSIAMALVSGAAATPNPPVTMTPSGGNFSPTAAAPPPSGTPSIPSSSMKKAKGRPPASSKKQQVEALGSVGIGFMPHVITVKAGEDVSAKIMSFSQQGPRAICILSANGAISNVTLRQAATFGGTATYEGRFDILSLSGSFLLSEVGGQRSRTGGLSVSLAGPDGRVLGGCVAGLLIAASPVQVVVGSFMADGHKESKSMNHFEPSSASLKVNPGGASGASSPPSRETFSESSAGPGSPHNQSTGACNNFNPQGISSMAWK